MKNRRDWIELGVATAAFGALSGIVWVTDAPRELVPVWMGGVLGLAGTGYWRGRYCLPRLRGGARS